MSLLEDSEIKELVVKAIDAKKNSYSPYSKFRVGCSLLTKEGILYTGWYFNLNQKKKFILIF